MKSRFMYLLVPVLLFGVPGLQGQERTTKEPVLVGRVIDAATGNPIVGAFVHPDQERWGVLTDEAGRFRLTGISDLPISVAVEQLGYVTLVQPDLVPDESIPILVALEPDPVLLEGIQVVTDRFERRRRALAVPSQVFDREELITSPFFNVLDFVSSRTLLRPFRCGGISIDGICAYVRGRVRPVTVYVDEAPFLGGLEFLNMMEPHELHRVEVYRSGAHIRVYTEAFMERAARIRLTPLGVLW